MMVSTRLHRSLLTIRVRWIHRTLFDAATLALVSILEIVCFNGALIQEAGIREGSTEPVQGCIAHLRAS